jgi:hypothetical protein
MLALLALVSGCVGQSPIKEAVANTSCPDSMPDYAAHLIVVKSDEGLENDYLQIEDNGNFQYLPLFGGSTYNKATKSYTEGELSTSMDYYDSGKNSTMHVKVAFDLKDAKLTSLSEVPSDFFSHFSFSYHINFYKIENATLKMDCRIV